MAKRKSKIKVKSKLGNSLKSLKCSNNMPGGKYWFGRYCNRSVLVDENTDVVTCFRCVAINVGPPEEDKPKIKRARGWKFMAEYVDCEGNVFHKGVEQKHLKGTLPETMISPKKSKPKPKINKENNFNIKIKVGTLKKKLKNESNPKEIKKIEAAIRKLESKIVR